ncbi:uncharacterized protein G2W53_028106 [Senna tora]|uniref:Uncharacterized protein n=1 Tax=Senna tora TaxID=362788 RepID=A0A834T2Z3_9FABA|nr:uncharacterized protein G2W53_028106 [Senna tora]
MEKIKSGKWGPGEFVHKAVPREASAAS